MHTDRLSWAGIDAELGHFDLVKETSLKWYDSSAIAKRGFRSDCRTSVLYRLYIAYIIAIAPGTFDYSSEFKVARKIYAASHRALGHTK